MATKKFNLLLALLTFTIYSSCAQPKTQINPEAKKLNDSAVYMVFNAKRPDSTVYIRAISLLDKAIKLDSNYLTAYLNKFGEQGQLKRYTNTIATGKQILKLAPDFYIIKQYIGFLYEKMGDTTTANRYYNSALVTCNKLLDTMRSENKAFKQIEADKAIHLILLRKDNEGREILKNLYNKEPEGSFKELLKEYLTKTRQDLLPWNQSNEVSEGPNKKH